ncbi:SV2A protein, partial [Tachuris rubrigastra]|nr:SV2A protein [Tachuris rubrigastra]
DEYTRRSYSRFEEEEDDEDYAPQDGYYRGGEGANEEEGASSDATEGHDEEDEIYEGEYQGIPRQESLKGGERLGAATATGAFDDSEGQRRKDREELAQQYELILQECGHGRFQWTLYFVLGLALMADGVEVFVVGFVLPSAEKDMCLSDSNKGMLGLIVYLGMMVGAFVWGGLADRLGRRQCLLISLSVNSVFAFFSSFVQGYGTFLFCRLLSGVGIGGSIPIVFSYFSEFLAQEKRGEHLSWLCMFWMIGGIYASAMAWAIIPHYGWSFQMGSAYQFHSWRVFVLVCAFPSVFAIGALTTMPESPRFYLENGKHDEAWMVLKQVHDTNMRAKGHPERVFSVTHIKTIKREDELIEIQSDTGTWYRRWLVRCLNLSQQVWSNFQQCFAPEFRRVTLMMMAVWFTMSFSYYGLTVWFPDMIKHLQSIEYAARTKLFTREKVRHFTFNFTLENQVHRGGEYFNDNEVLGAKSNFGCNESFWVQEVRFLGARSEVLGAKSEVLGAMSEVLGAMSEVLCAKSEVLGALSEVLGARSEVPVWGLRAAGFLFVGAACQPWGAGCQFWGTGVPVSGHWGASFGALGCQFWGTGVPVLGHWGASFGTLACHPWGCRVPILGFPQRTTPLSRAPPSPRTTAFGFLNALCKLAAVLGISIFTSFVGITKAVPILLASAALALGSSLALKLPETRGQVLQ